MSIRKMKKHDVKYKLAIGLIPHGEENIFEKTINPNPKPFYS